MADNMDLNNLSLAHEIEVNFQVEVEVEVVDLTGVATDDEQSVTVHPSSSGYLAESDSDHTVVDGYKAFTGGYDTTDEEQSVTADPSSPGYLTEPGSERTVISGSKKVFTGGYATADDEQSFTFDPSSSGHLAESDSDHTVVGGSKEVFTGGHDTNDDEQSEPSSGYVTEDVQEHIIAHVRKEVIPGDYDIGTQERNVNHGIEGSYYSEYEEHLDGDLTNEECDKKYPEFLAHLHKVGYEAQQSRSLFSPNKSVRQKITQSAPQEQASVKPNISLAEKLKVEEKSMTSTKVPTTMGPKNLVEKDVFCCNGGLKLNARSSSAYLPDNKHADIKVFMEAVDGGDIQYAIGKIAPEDVKKITMVIKVNFREDYEDLATVFFAATAEFTENPVKKYTAFAKLEEPQRFDLNGERGFLAYFCKAHRKMMVRVGQHTIKWTSKHSFAHWGNAALDDLMGHPKKVTENYGQPPVTFTSFSGLG